MDYSALYRVLPFSPAVDPVKVDFYGALSGIANQITANRESTRDQQNKDRQFAASEAARNQAQANNARDFSFREAEARRAQGNADRSYSIQERALTEKPSYQTVEDASGQKRLVRIDPLGGAVTDVTPGGASAPTNPYAAGGKMTEAQSKDALYSSRMMNSENVLSDPSVVAAAQSRADRGKAYVPVFGNSLVSKDYQRFDQAKRDFINAILRRESGAAISESEFDNANKQYFPQPGDGPDVLRQKAMNRAEAIRGFAAGAGQNWSPPFLFDDASGRLVRNPSVGGRGAPSSPGGPPAPSSTAIPPPPDGFRIVR